MDLEVFPGPSLAELARTAIAQATAATVSQTGPVPAGQVPVLAVRDGSLLLLPATGSLLEQRLVASPGPVTVSVPAREPFPALRLTGPVRRTACNRAAGITACTVAVRSVELVGATPARIPLAEYRAAEPDPLWRQAPGILAHLERRHMADLVGCVRAHGMQAADWVIPRGLDRYGLELLVLATGGVAVVRLSFPDGPVTSLQDVPTSIRALMTCRCQSSTGHHNGRAASE